MLQHAPHPLACVYSRPEAAGITPKLPLLAGSCKARLASLAEEAKEALLLLLGRHLRADRALAVQLLRSTGSVAQVSGLSGQVWNSKAYVGRFQNMQPAKLKESGRH